MAQISITKTYANGEILLEADLDNIKDDVETFLNTTKINDDNIQTAGITGSTKLVDASVTNAKLAANSVDTTQIVDDCVTGAKLAAAVAGSGLAQDGSGNLDVQVDGTTIEISTDTLQIVDNGITQAKLANRTASTTPAAAGDILLTSSCSNFTTTDTSYAAITNFSGTLVTSGRPVRVCFVPDGGSTANRILGSSGCTIKLLRDSTAIGYFYCDNSGSLNLPAGCIDTLDSVAAGSYTYSAEIKVTSGTSYVQYMKLLAYEI